MIEVLHLPGLVSYEDGLAYQERLVARILADESPETLLLLEHQPVYTIGRLRDRSSLRAPGSLPFAVHETNRGGQATYHGPGQLVGYPLLNLARRGKDLHLHLRKIEETILRTCAAFGVEAGRREGLTGVWVGDRKLASIGVGVRKWISMHGFALNVTAASLPPFHAITPCGLDGVAMTALETEASRPLSVAEVATAFSAEFRKEFQLPGPAAQPEI